MPGLKLSVLYAGQLVEKLPLSRKIDRTLDTGILGLRVPLRMNRIDPWELLDERLQAQQATDNGIVISQTTVGRQDDGGDLEIDQLAASQTEVWLFPHRVSDCPFSPVQSLAPVSLHKPLEMKCLSYGERVVEPMALSYRRALGHATTVIFPPVRTCWKSYFRNQTEQGFPNNWVGPFLRMERERDVVHTVP